MAQMSNAWDLTKVSDGKRPLPRYDPHGEDTKSSPYLSNTQHHRKPKPVVLLSHISSLDTVTEKVRGVREGERERGIRVGGREGGRV